MWATNCLELQTLRHPKQATGVDASSAQDITTRTELVLADCFERIVTVDNGLSGL